MDLAATGQEINPAAAILARTYELCGFSGRRREKIVSNVEGKLASTISRNEPLFEGLGGGRKSGAPRSRLKDIVRSSSGAERCLLETLTLLAPRTGREPKGMAEGEKIWKAWKKLRGLVSSLPRTEKKIRAHLSDAREPAEGEEEAGLLGEDSVDFVLTSPPYINVLNYHQNYRASVEELGWDVLRAARSEIGSNRKFRRNRFLTVVQYCMDMAGCFRKLKRVARPSARMIFVVGRESSVLGTPFYNGELLRRVAEESGLLTLVQKQERAYRNRFGKNIKEDILHFEVGGGSPSGAKETARRVGTGALRSAVGRAPSGSLEDLRAAITEAEDVSPSDIFDPEGQDTGFFSVAPAADSR